ncbi:MAG TPA: Flp pilus assembly protein CpaB [Dehalococcoidia bacterium]|jgi:pilus assembly protein CpaB
MSRPASALNTGQTNKKFLYMALGLGLLGALLVYVAFSRSGGSGSVGSGDHVPVVVAKSDIEARTKITASMVEVKLLPADDASSLAYTDTAQVIGQTTRFPIAANEQVLSNKIVDLTGATSPGGKSLSFTIPQGMRAIAVNVKDVTDAGGLLLPGDYVDVLVVYNVDFLNDPSSPSSHEKVDNFYIRTIMQAKEVLAVKQTIVDTVPDAVGTPGAAADNSAPRSRNTEAKPEPDAQTVTLALTPEDAQLLYFAEQNGKIRFAVRPYGDIAEKPVDPMIQPDLFPRNLPNPFVR